MASHDSEDSRIRDGVRGSKIPRDACTMEAHHGLKHGEMTVAQLFHGEERVFPRKSTGEQQWRKNTDIISSNDEIERWFQNYMRNEAPFLGIYRRNTESESIIVRFKRNLPAFDGTWHTDDFISWVDDLDDFFQEVKPPVALKCRIALYKMEGAAYDWWKQIQYGRNRCGKEEIISWPRMKNMLLNKFSPTNCSTECSIPSFSVKPGRKEIEYAEEKSDCYVADAVHLVEIVTSENEHSAVDAKEYVNTKDGSLPHTNCSIKCPIEVHNRKLDEKQAEALKGTLDFVDGREKDDKQILDEDEGSNNGRSRETKEKSIEVPHSASPFPISKTSIREKPPTTVLKDVVPIKYNDNSSQVLAISYLAASYQHEYGIGTQQVNAKYIREKVFSCYPCLSNDRCSTCEDHYEVTEAELLAGPIMAIIFDPGGLFCSIRTHSRCNIYDVEVKRRTWDLKKGGAESKVQMQSNPSIPKERWFETGITQQGHVLFNCSGQQHQVKMPKLVNGFNRSTTLFAVGYMNLSYLMLSECKGSNYSKFVLLLFDPGGNFGPVKTQAQLLAALMSCRNAQTMHRNSDWNLGMMIRVEKFKRNVPCLSEPLDNLVSIRADYGSCDPPMLVRIDVGDLELGFYSDVGTGPAHHDDVMVCRSWNDLITTKSLTVCIPTPLVLKHTWLQYVKKASNAHLMNTSKDRSWGITTLIFAKMNASMKEMIGMIDTDDGRIYSIKELNTGPLKYIVGKESLDYGEFIDVSLYSIGNWQYVAVCFWLNHAISTAMFEVLRTLTELMTIQPRIFLTQPSLIHSLFVGSIAQINYPMIITAIYDQMEPSLAQLIALPIACNCVIPRPSQNHCDNGISLGQSIQCLQIFGHLGVLVPRVKRTIILLSMMSLDASCFGHLLGNFLAFTEIVCPLNESSLLLSCSFAGLSGQLALQRPKGLTYIDLSYILVGNFWSVFKSSLLWHVSLADVLNGKCMVFNVDPGGYWIIDEFQSPWLFPLYVCLNRMKEREYITLVMSLEMYHTEEKDETFGTACQMLRRSVIFSSFHGHWGYNFNLTRGRVIPWKGWNYVENTNTDGGFVMANQSVDTFTLRLRLFFKLVNRLDPPKTSYGFARGRAFFCLGGWTDVGTSCYVLGFWSTNSFMGF